MSIRDIIEAATPGPWRIATSKSVKVGDRTICRTHDRKWRYGNDEQETNDARFIATFDPEHVALMEAMCGAAEEAIAGVETEIADFNTAAPCEMRIENVEWDNTAMTLDLSHFINLRIVCIALAAYRKERGL